MNKQDTLESIQKARLSHLTQMEKIDAVFEGKEVKDPTAVAKTDCAFGKWLYNGENHLREILGVQFYDNMEVLHGRWHAEYRRLFDIFFANQKKSFFGKMKAPKVEGMELDKAKLYHSELKQTTEELLKALASSERRISALNESKFS